jgi:hypothetical protein
VVVSPLFLPCGRVKSHLAFLFCRALLLLLLLLLQPLLLLQLLLDFPPPNRLQRRCTDFGNGRRSDFAKQPTTRSWRQKWRL